MYKKHLVSLIFGIILILIGISIIPIGIYCSKYVIDKFPEISFMLETSDSEKQNISEDQGLLQTIVSKLGLDKLVDKMDDIIQDQKKMREGYNQSFYNIQAEIKYVLKMQAVYIIITSIIISLIFIIFGSLSLTFHVILVNQNKTYMLEESIKNEIVVYKENK